MSIRKKIRLLIRWGQGNKENYEKRRRSAKRSSRGIRKSEKRARKIGIDASTNRTKSEVDRRHGTDFYKEITSLKKRFPDQTIKVLDEGCGKSSLAEELRGPKVETVRSDILAISDSPDFHQVSVHQLEKHFGKNKFHLVISTVGGTVRGGNTERAMANIHSILKSGGKAFIAGIVFSHSKWEKAAIKLGFQYKMTRWGIIIFK